MNDGQTHARALPKTTHAMHAPPARAGAPHLRTINACLAPVFSVLDKPLLTAEGLPKGASGAGVVAGACVRARAHAGVCGLTAERERAAGGAAAQPLAAMHHTVHHLLPLPAARGRLCSKPPAVLEPVTAAVHAPHASLGVR